MPSGYSRSMEQVNFIQGLELRSTILNTAISNTAKKELDTLRKYEKLESPSSINNGIQYVKGEDISHRIKS